MDKIKFLGASGTVTGSGYFLANKNQRGILIDLGMFQGTTQINKLNRLPLELDVKALDGVILTHAHLDHCGRLPLLAKFGFSGKVFMTPPTRDLAEIVLLDSANIAERNTEEKPLYDIQDARQIINNFQTVSYHQPFEIGEFRINLIDAGHLLGSATVEVTKDDKKIVFSGDLGNSPQRLVRPTQNITKADFVVMESTYGDREHPNENTQDILQKEINAVEKSGGTLLIPAFALNRSQDLLNRIKHLKKENKVDNTTPVYFDSPMAIKATTVHLAHKDFFNDPIKKESRNEPLFEFPGLVVTDSAKQSRQIAKSKGTKVIVAGSGMMTGGRILNHAADYLPKESTRLLIIGYQGEETIGREIVEGATNINVYGEDVTINATLTRIHGMSSHAGQSALINWFDTIKGVEKLILTHGEDSSRKGLSDKITKTLGAKDITLPKINEEHYL